MGSGALQVPPSPGGQGYHSNVGDVVTSDLAWPQRLLKDAPEHSWMVYQIFGWLPWTQNLQLLAASRSVRTFFNPEDPKATFWRWLCRCLCAESRLYLPSDQDLLLLSGADFRGLAQDLGSLRYIFTDESKERKAEHFRVSTFCRVRPARKCDDEDTSQNLPPETKVQLPLNQRVVLLQQKDPSLSRAEAVKMLINKECGAGEPLAEIDNVLNQVQENGELSLKIPSPTEQIQPKGGDENLTPELPGFTASILNVTPGVAGSVLTVSPGIGLRNWGFQCVFDQASSQSDLHGACGLRLAMGLMNGRSGALIVYGQTGSGKTHTMFGDGSNGFDGGAQAGGLVTSIAEDVLRAVAERQAQGFEVMLGASYVEVFGNDITNLLGGPLGINRGQSQRMGHKYVLEGRCEEPVPDKSTFQDLLQRGNERKRKATTEMNERSTRAHTLVIFRLRQRAPQQEAFVESQLFLADLGGSEKVSKSKANENLCAPGGVNVGDEEVSRVSWQEYYKCRERITETNHINKGLLTLKCCVHALNERQKSAKNGAPSLPRVPFNDSKLTMLLQPALTGESSTSVVVCCAPENLHAEETVQSLRFGEMCSAVEHETAGAAKDAGLAVREALQRIDGEIKDLEAQILRKEHWEWKKTTRLHIVDEMDEEMVVCNKEEEMELGGRGTVEIKADDGTSRKRTAEHEVWGQVLVGAEAENARRDELIKMRMRLLGED